MNPGHELDKLIAIEVMGWKILSHWEPGVVKHLLDENQIEVNPPEFKNYSTDISAAWEVANKVIRQFEDGNWQLAFDVTYDGFSSRGWTARFCIEKKPVYLSHDDPMAGSDSPAHAICLAALKAVGYAY